MKLIDADRLFEIIDYDKYELNNHTGQAIAIHNGEYNHFLKRIQEQPEVHLTIELCYPDGRSIRNVELN